MPPTSARQKSPDGVNVGASNAPVATDDRHPEIYARRRHDPVRHIRNIRARNQAHRVHNLHGERRSEEHTSELQSLRHLVCRLLLEKKTNKTLTGVLNTVDDYAGSILFSAAVT